MAGRGGGTARFGRGAGGRLRGRHVLVKVHILIEGLLPTGAPPRGGGGVCGLWLLQRETQEEKVGGVREVLGETKRDRTAKALLNNWKL